MVLFAQSVLMFGTTNFYTECMLGRIGVQAKADTSLVLLLPSL